MSELTEIVSILFKNLSDALLLSASEIRKLNNPTPPLSQAREKPEIVSTEAPRFTKRENYKVGDRIMVMLDGAILPTKFKISGLLPDGEYLAYAQKLPKSTARKITYEQILGLDPDR